MNEKCLYTFEPIKIGFDFWLWMPVVLIVLCIVAGIVSQKKIDEKNRRLTVLMLLSFVCVICFFTSLSRLYALWHMTPVKLYTEHIETPFGKPKYTDVKDFFIRTQNDYKPMQPDVARDSIRYLMIIERSDKTHLLSEADYQIDSIFVKLDEEMK